MSELKELMLRRPRLTLAVAESLTAGHVQAQVAAVSGASDFFLGGITAYSLDEKVRHLGVNRATAKKVNCVSTAVAEQMARGVCGLFDADVGLATTGYAEPFDSPQGGPSAADAVAVPFAWWAVAARRRPFDKLRAGGGRFSMRHGRVECPGEPRVEVQAIVAAAAVAELVAFLRELRGR
jgi:nicotinamide-nucleotide amidase